MVPGLSALTETLGNPGPISAGGMAETTLPKPQIIQLMTVHFFSFKGLLSPRHFLNSS